MTRDTFKAKGTPPPATPSAPVGVETGLLRWVKAQADDPDANPRFRELYAALSQQPTVDGCHCGTCTCNPNMTPAVRFDLSPAQQEGAIREHLIRLGWTPPVNVKPLSEFMAEQEALHPGIHDKVQAATDELRASLAQQPAACDMGVLTPTGTFCSVCEAPQHNTPSGVSCPNGHGGVAALAQQLASEAERAFFAQDFYEEAREGKKPWPAQQPAADPRSTHRVWRGDDWQPCYCEATNDHRIGSEQPAAVDETQGTVDGWRLVVRYDEHNNEPCVWAEKDGSLVWIATLTGEHNGQD